jgi:serine/threonine protein kinase
VESTPRPGLISGRYELGEVIGTGGMGEVRQARDLKTDRPVAIKFLRPHTDPELDVRSRFETEASAASQLTHPNIVAVFDYGEEQGIPFIVMELLSGRTLSHKLSDGPLEESEVRRLGLEILSALEASHAEGILHRDLKPGNVMLAQNDSAKVADFGIAKIIEGVDMTETGTMLGTPAYLAPERVAGEPATPASDIYSAGVVLYELLTAKKPFDADTPLGLVRAIQEEDPTPLSEARPDVDPELVEIVEKAMAKDPAKRYATALQMGQALRNWIPSVASESTQSIPPASSTQGFKVRSKGRSRVRRRLAGILLGIIAVAWPVFVITRISDSGPDVSASPSPQPPTPSGLIAPPLNDALGRLEGALVETGTAGALQPGVQALRAAAQAGDRTLASQHVAQLKARLTELGPQAALPGPDFQKVLAALGEVEVQLASITPSAPPAPPAPPGPPAPPAPPAPPNP